MIKIFESTATNFTSNGIITIKPLKAIETKKQSLNGWFLDISIPIKYRDYIEQDTIVVAKVKGSLNPQAFRVNNITYTKRTIDFTADHIVFDTKYLLIEDTRPTNATAQYALVNANDNTVDPSNFTFTSNVGGSNTAYLVNKTMLEAMDIIQDKWGGKFVIDNYNIRLEKSPGYDNGEIISYGKNLEDIKIFEDWSNVVTKMKPRGFDGITLPEVFLYSEQTYDQPYTKTIKFDTEIDEEDRTNELLIEELREISLAYIEENQFPKVSYEVKSDINQDLDIYDTVTVKHPIVTLTTEVQEYEYNLNTKRVIKIVFGNYNRDVKKRFDTIKDDISKNKDQMNKVEEIVGKQTDLINSMNKFGYVYIDDNQIMILDKLPKESAKNVWRWNLGGLGFSNNGIEGPFKLAWTIDGVFNTDFIAANTIMVGHLHSDVGSSLDLSSNESINIMVNQSNMGSIYINLNGEYGHKGWSGNSNALRQIYEARDTYIDEYLTYGMGFVIEEIPEAISEKGHNYYNSGLHLIDPSHIVQGKDYSFKSEVEVRSTDDEERSIVVSTYEYDSIGATPTITNHTFIAENGSIEFTMTPRNSTRLISLGFDVEADIDNRIIMYDRMFNIGEPKGYFVSTESAKNYASSLFEMLADKVIVAVDSDGKLVQVELGIDPDKGSTFMVEADNINLTGYVTVSDLAGTGTTVIDGSNIRTGKISAEFINFNNAVGNNVRLTGEINATTGKIGGYVISGDELRGANLVLRRDEIQIGHAKLGTPDGGTLVIEIPNPTRNFVVFESGIQLSGSLFTNAEVNGGPAQFDSLAVFQAITPAMKSFNPPMGRSDMRMGPIFTTAQLNVGSDSRYKKNILSLNKHFVKVFGDSLNAVQYSMLDNDENELNIGYTAQDVEAALYKANYKLYGRHRAMEEVRKYLLLHKDESYMSLLYNEIAVLMNEYHKIKYYELENKLNNLLNERKKELWT